MSFLLGLNRRTIRAPLNPLDKSTVVSIFPKDIHETKCTLQPGDFKIAAGTYDKPSVLVVTSSSWWKEMEENQPLLEIPNSSIQVADSIVKDYCNGLFGCDMDNLMPGLFYIPGEVTVEEVKSKHKIQLNAALVKQKNWFHKIVTEADKMWARSNGNPVSIGDTERLAARELNLNDKEWLKDFQTVSMVRCPACGTLKNPIFPICPNCKSGDIDAVKKLGLISIS